MSISLAYQYLHLETWLLLPFLAMLVLTQLSRAREPAHFVRNGQMQAMGLFGMFLILACVFSSFLSDISPLLAFELAAGFTLALLHPVNALCFFVQMLFLRPWDILTGNHLLLALPRIMALTCLVSWILYPWKYHKPGRLTFRALFFLLAFSLWLFLSTFVTPNITDAQATWFDIYFKSLVVFVMSSFFIENKRSVSEFKYTILLGIFSVAIIGFYQFFSSDAPLAARSRLSAVAMLDPNDLAAMSVIALPLALAPLFSRVKGISQRLSGLLFCAVSLLTIWYSRSRGALLGIVAQAVGFQFIRGFRKSRMLAVSMVSLIFLGYLFILGTVQRSAEDMEISRESRITYWKTAVKMTIANPLLGVGFNQFPEKYEAYSPTLEFEAGKRTVHSSWLLAFSESGVLGGVLFIAFFFTVLQAAWLNRRERPEQLYALGGYGVAMSFLSHTYLMFPYLVYGLILASDSVKESREAGSVSA